MQKFDYDADGTIEEFRRRIDKTSGIQLNLTSPQLVTSLSAAMWFAVEEYEKIVSQQMRDNGIGEEGTPPNLADFYALHQLTHDFSDILRQLFMNVGMELVNIPNSCKSPESVINELKDMLKSKFGDNIEVLDLTDVDLPGVPADDDEEDVSVRPEEGSVDNADKAE